jgi:hypothetical protein
MNSASRSSTPCTCSPLTKAREPERNCSDGPAVLWVADPNPRAQAFYRRNRFTVDGAERVEDGVREIRMQRPAL